MQKGQTLIELLIALSIAVILITIVTSTVVSSLSNAQSSKSRSTASKYSQEGMETIRRIRDSDIKQFKNYNGTFCLGKDQITLGNQATNCTTPNIDSFIRSVVIENFPGCEPNVAKITVNVSWVDNKCVNNTYCQKISLVSCLSTRNPVNSP